MGNTCQLPLLTPTIPEIGAGRVKSATAVDYSAKCGRCSPQSIGRLHRMCTVARCFRVAVTAGSGAELKTLGN
jgi:hypothetical protein